MNTKKRARGVHSSRRYGYTHTDAHVAILSKSMRRSRSTSKRSYARVSTDSSARWARPAASGPSRITPRATRGRWGPRPSGSAVGRRVTVSFGGIPTCRVGSRSRSTRDSRASFLATVTGYRALGMVFRVFSRIVRSRPVAPPHAPPSRVLLASRAPRSLAIPVTPAFRHGLNSAPDPRVLPSPQPPPFAPSCRLFPVPPLAGARRRWSARCNRRRRRRCPA